MPPLHITPPHRPAPARCAALHAGILTASLGGRSWPGPCASQGRRWVPGHLLQAHYWEVWLECYTPAGAGVAEHRHPGWGCPCSVYTGWGLCKGLQRSNVLPRRPDHFDQQSEGCGGRAAMPLPTEPHGHTFHSPAPQRSKLGWRWGSWRPNEKQGLCSDSVLQGLGWLRVEPRAPSTASLGHTTPNRPRSLLSILIFMQPL